MERKWVFENSPFEMLAEAFKRLYPDVEYKAFIDPYIRPAEGNKKAYGLTDFDDGNITIYIDSELKIVDAIEIFAHELAHAAVGVEHDHDEAWESAFDALFEEYNKIGDELFAENKEGEDESVNEM